MKTAALEKSSHLEYFNIAVSVDCVIFGYENKELKVLLIKSDLQEFTGLYSLLGDLVRPDEDLEDAPYRVLKRPFRCLPGAGGCFWQHTPSPIGPRNNNSILLIGEYEQH